MKPTSGTMRKKRRHRKKKNRWLIRARVLGVLVGLTAAMVVGNWIYQVWRKPSELISLFQDGLYKTPTETWRAYGETFHEKSTPVLTADFLAALAQMESSGNPIVRTYWKWTWTSGLDRLYAPASTAVGMFQITHGTFEEARRYCLQGRRVRQASSSEDLGPCWKNKFYSRLVPSHAIEMTSARLHSLMEKSIQRYGVRRATLRQKQDLAAIIHLCGEQKGRRFAQARFSTVSVGRCGDHDPSVYLRRLRTLQAQFRSLAERNGERLLAHSQDGAGL